MLIYTLVILSVVAVMIWLFFWTWVRYQKIAKQNSPEAWWSKAFWGTLIFAVIMITITMILYLVS